MKRNLLLGTAAGKLGDIVLYRTDGEQRARAYIKNVSNPRSLAQVIQRVCLAACSQAYNTMYEIVNHSFQGKMRAKDNQQRFMKLNLDQMRAYIGDGQYAENFCWFPNKGEKGFHPWNFIISEGTLPEPRWLHVQYNAIDLGYYSIVEGQVTPYEGITHAATYAEVAASLGVPAGSQITICVVGFNSQDLSYSESYGYPRFIYKRLILRPSDGDLSKRMFTDGPTGNTKVLNDPDPNSDFFLFNLHNVEGVENYNRALTIDFEPNGFQPDGYEFTYLLGSITSLYVNNAWRRSKSYLYNIYDPHAPATSVYPSLMPYTSGTNDHNLRNACNSWSAGVFSTQYLNRSAQYGYTKDDWDGVKGRSAFNPLATRQVDEEPAPTEKAPTKKAAKKKDATDNE